MSEERDKKLYETAISLRPYVYAAMNEAKFGFIPEKMWSKDCIWRDFKKLLDGE